jgi:excisionase family DNA binding protein
MDHRTVGGRYVDSYGENGVGVAAKMTVEEAARILGIKEESVRKRVRRGKMRSEKDADGRLYVYVYGTEAVPDGKGDASQGLYGDWSRDGLTDAAREVMKAKDETIRILQHQLEEEREARRRADTIIAQLTQLNVALTARVPGLGDPPIEPPDTDGKAVATAEGGPMTAERGSWWRRRLGGE